MKGTIITDAVKDINGCQTEAQLKKVRKRYLGPAGVITKELLSIPKLAYNVRKAQSKSVLQLQESFNTVFDRRRGELNGDTTKRS